MSACLGKPLYVEDFISANALKLKILQSPHAYACIEKIDSSHAMHPLPRPFPRLTKHTTIEGSFQQAGE